MKKKITFTLNAKEAIVNSSDKLGRHNTMAKSHVHKSKKDYDKKRSKRDWRKEMDNNRGSFIFFLH
ncbi:hypothetical protein GC105_07395 [Alkalibaculum sp. M08DMB]|uniref:Uncharacterized protein n=1 Tax=Alkalibaculum sporogenes TaxID=2655001 RepID=A0A6A7K8B2_9FIRM|nr:hypothetical protein [Alkalibaculum sporogenes]MPW25612.1 hypothetical protein [Alkalibaculum sporogenes]